MEFHRQTQVLYDGDCPICQANVRLFQRLDWLRTARFVAIAEAGEIARHYGIRAEALLQAIHSIDAEGRVERGADCFRRIGLRIPLLAPLALLLWVPGIHWLGNRVYAAVSRNRHTLSGWFGCRGACALPRTPPPTVKMGSAQNNSHDLGTHSQ